MKYKIYTDGACSGNPGPGGWGAVIFDDWPDLTAWFGMILIIGSGLFMVWRETVTRADSTAQRRRIRR